MDEVGRASHWSGYNSLSNVVNYSVDPFRPLSPPPPQRQPPANNVENSLGQAWWPSSPSSAGSPLSSPSTVAMSPPHFNSFCVPEAYPDSVSPSSYATPYSSFPSPSASFRAASPSAHIISQSNYPPFAVQQQDFSFHSSDRLRPGPIVPQKKYYASSNNSGSNPIIIPFRYSHNSEDGIPMQDLRGLAALDKPIVGRDATPFDASVATTITLRIWWPGYKQWSRRMTMRKATGLLTTCELAMAVTEVYNDFLQSACLDPTSDPSVAQWAIGGVGGIQLDHLTLLRVEQVSQGSWQADIRLTHELRETTNHNRRNYA